MINLSKEKTLQNPLHSSQSFERVKTTKKYFKFNLLLTLGIMIPTAIVGVTNIIINPYDLFRVPKIAGFNQTKPALWRNGRLMKAVQITQIKPVALYLGSSRVEFGLDPDHPIFTDNQPAYNLGLGAASPTEMLLYLKHTLLNQPNLKKVVIGIDEFMFNELNYSTPVAEHRLGKTGLTLRDAVETTISLKALKDSHQTLEFSQKYPDYETYTPKGQLNLRPVDKDSEAVFYRFRQSMSIYFKEFSTYHVSQQQLQDFAEIIRICQENKIEYQVFFSPSHGSRWQVVNRAGHWEQFEQLKREIVQITPYWDFSGFNSVTTEPISKSMNNYIDDSHYTKPIGDLVLNKMFNLETEKIPQDFGVFLTPQNIESHLQNIKQNRDNWLTRNPQTVEMINQVQASVTK